MKTTKLLSKSWERDAGAPWQQELNDPKFNIRAKASPFWVHHRHSSNWIAAAGAVAARRDHIFCASSSLLFFDLSSFTAFSLCPSSVWPPPPPAGARSVLLFWFWFEFKWRGARVVGPAAAPRKDRKRKHRKKERAKEGTTTSPARVRVPTGYLFWMFSLDVNFNDRLDQGYGLVRSFG